MDTLGARRAACLLLEPDGCLTFVGDASCETEKRGSRIEEPSDRRRSERAQVMIHELQGVRVAAREQEWRRRYVGQATQLIEESRRRLHGMPRRCVPTRQARLSQMRDTPETLAHAPDEQFAAPDGSVVAVSGAIARDAEHSGIPGAPLGHHRRDVGAMVLNGEDVRRVQCQRRHR